MKIGIDQISFYVPKQYLNLSVLAARKNINPEKFSHGIGQDKIAVPSHDEDIVTMGAEAAYSLLENCDDDQIDTLLFATETAIDQSKSAGIYVHRLLNLPKHCRNVELKQACYGGTAALQMACGYVARKPNKKVLIITSDISRYDIDTPGEATQGAGAVAMLISVNPRIMEIDNISGCYSEDIMDFWRPNYRQTPFVDGKYSALKYLHALAHTWEDYKLNGGREFSEFEQFCYHLPFTRMGKKAHKHLCAINQSDMDEAQIQAGTVYNRQIGNCYNASLYLSMISMLENFEGDLSNQAVGLFSYGSGASAEFFSGVVQPGYQDNLHVERHRQLIENRMPLEYEDYISCWNIPYSQDGSEYLINGQTDGRYRLSGFRDHKRHYEIVA